MFAGRPWSDWITDYGKSHQNPVNRVCHTIGIPLIMLSFPLLFLLLVDRGLWIVPVGAFVFGWILQFIGHAFEGKPPEFFKDWRFLLVGARWWFAKIRGRV